MNRLVCPNKFTYVGMSTAVKSCLTRTFLLLSPFRRMKQKEDSKLMGSGIYLKQEAPIHFNFLPLRKLHRNFVYSERYPRYRMILNQ